MGIKRLPSRSAVAAIILSISSLSGCQDSGTGTDYEYQPIGSRVNIQLFVPLPDSVNLILNCATEEYYPCCNYAIAYHLDRLGRTTTVNFTGIAIPNICATAFGPATCRIPLTSLSPGSYDLTFLVNGRIRFFKLAVSDTSYTVSGTDTDAVAFVHSKLMRIPEGTVWGYIGYPALSVAPLVRSFLDSARAVGCQTVRLPEGNYYYFSVDAGGKLVLPGNYGYYFMEQFVFSFSGKPASIEGLVARYGKTYGDSLSIAVLDTRGNVFYSWVLSQD